MYLMVDQVSFHIVTIEVNKRTIALPATTTDLSSRNGSG